MRVEGAEVLQGELVTKVVECSISPLIFPPFDLGREVRWTLGLLPKKITKTRLIFVYSTVMLCEVLINNIGVTMSVMRFTITLATNPNDFSV